MSDVSMQELLDNPKAVEDLLAHFAAHPDEMTGKMILIIPKLYVQGVARIVLNDIWSNYADGDNHDELEASFRTALEEELPSRHLKDECFQWGELLGSLKEVLAARFEEKLQGVIEAILKERQEEDVVV